MLSFHVLLCLSEPHFEELATLHLCTRIQGLPESVLSWQPAVSSDLVASLRRCFRIDIDGDLPFACTIDTDNILCQRRMHMAELASPDLVAGNSIVAKSSLAQ